MRHRMLMFVLCLAATATAVAGPTYTDPDKTDADYAYQGEYTGELQTKDGKGKFGVQIIAMGKGQFSAVGFHGGLPGDGWNGEDPIRISGKENAKLQDGELHLKSDHGLGVVKDGVLTVTSEAGKVAGQLKKVVRESPTLGAKPPANAVVLFDGSSADNWKNGKMENGLLMQGTTSKDMFQSHKLHIEFRLPYKPEDRDKVAATAACTCRGDMKSRCSIHSGWRAK